MSLILKRDQTWLEVLPQRDSNEASVLLIGKDGCQVSVSAALLLAASPLVRSILSGRGIPPALSLSIPAVSGDVLRAVGEMLKKGSSYLSHETVEKTREVFKMLEVEAVMNCDDFDSGLKKRVKDEEANDIFVNSDVKNECSIEIKVEIEKQDNVRNVSIFDKLSEQNIPSEFTKTTVKSVFKCDQCEYKTKTIRNFEEHKKKHNQKKYYKCDKCEFQSKLIRTLVAHKRTHIGERPFACDQCDYKAKRSSNLYSHKSIHTGEKRFMCDLCEYKCRDSSGLILHKIIHTAEKPYKCDQCDYEAKRGSNLITHKRIHTGERPFGCDRCKYSAKNRQTLVTHKRIHTGEKPFVCDMCEYKAREISHLTRHKLMHIGEKPFACDQCEYKGLGKSNLKEHFKRKHI